MFEMTAVIISYPQLQR